MVRRRPIVASHVYKCSGYCVGSSRSEFVSTQSAAAAAIIDRAAASSAARHIVHSLAAGAPNMAPSAQAPRSAARGVNGARAVVRFADSLASALLARTDAPRGARVKIDATAKNLLFSIATPSHMSSLSGAM